MSSNRRDPSMTVEETERKSHSILVEDQEDDEANQTTVAADTAAAAPDQPRHTRSQRGASSRDVESFLNSIRYPALITFQLCTVSGKLHPKKFIITESYIYSDSVAEKDNYLYVCHSKSDPKPQGVSDSITLIPVEDEQLETALKLMYMITWCSNNDIMTIPSRNYTWRVYKHMVGLAKEWKFNSISQQLASRCATMSVRPPNKKRKTTK